MAPEVFMKSNTEGHGRAADIWSIGCVIIEMASGKVCNNESMFVNFIKKNIVSFMCIETLV